MVGVIVFDWWELSSKHICDHPPPDFKTYFCLRKKWIQVFSRLFERTRRHVSYVHKSRRGQKTKGWKYFVRNFFLSIQNFLNKDKVLRNTFLLSWSCLNHFLRYRILNGLVTWNAPYLIRGWWIVAITIRKRNLQSNTMN